MAELTDTSGDPGLCGHIPAEQLAMLRAIVEAETGAPFDPEMPYVFEWGGYPIVGDGEEVLYLMAYLAGLVGSAPGGGSPS